MKKAVILFMLITSVYQLKAQTLFPLKPSDTSAGHLLYQKYFYNPGDTQTKQFMPFFNAGVLKGQVNYLAVTRSPVDHMPIARLHINSKMPVYRLYDNSKMPVIDPSTNRFLVHPKPDVAPTNP